MILRRGVGLCVVLAALLTLGIAGGATAWATDGPTPAHPIAGPRIDLPPALRLANPVGSPALVTPSQAHTVTVSMWQLREAALLERNTTAVSQLTAPGPLQSGEIYQCVWPAAGCVAETRARPVNGVTTIVPVQRSYPIYFLAEVSTIQNVAESNGSTQWVPWVELQVLTKADASAPWQLSFDTGYDGVGHLQPPLLPFAVQPGPGSSSTSSSDLYNPAPTDTPSNAGSTFLPLLAQYYQSFKDTGAPPTDDRFELDGGADGYGTQLGENRQGGVSMGSRNLYDFTADPSAGEWEFSGPGGLPIECGTVIDTATNTPVGAPLLAQNSDRTNWGMQLPPGFYTEIVTTATHPTCVEDVNGVLDAEGDSGYTSSVRGLGLPVSSGSIAGVLVLAGAGAFLVIGAIVLLVVLVTRRRRITPASTWSPGTSVPWAWPPPLPPPPPPPWQSPWRPPSGANPPPPNPPDAPAYTSGSSSLVGARGPTPEAQPAASDPPGSGMPTVPEQRS